MIRSPQPLTIRCLCLCLATLKRYLILGFQIPPSAWATVLQPVEQGEPLRHIAHDYGVSYEAVRRVLRAALAAKSEEHVSPNLPG
jgi:uncharacterized protein (DUF433 family)